MLSIWSLIPLPIQIQLEHLDVHSSQIVEAWLGEFWALLYYCVRWVQLWGRLNINPFLWDWNENWPFPVLWPLLSFPNKLAYWVQHFHSIIFKHLSLTGISSPPLALFVVMLPKAHWPHSRMSGSRQVITPSWLSGLWRSFFDSSVYSCLLLLISSAFVRSIPFLSFIVLIFAWKFPWYL